MGDHRATVTCRMEFHGKVYEYGPAWINYDGHGGPDQRVIDFFEDAWSAGYRRWQDANDKAERAQRNENLRRSEIVELARRKAKYAEAFEKVTDEEPAAHGYSRGELMRRIEVTSLLLAGQMPDAERLLLCADLAAYRKALAALDGAP